MWLCSREQDRIRDRLPSDAMQFHIHSSVIMCTHVIVEQYSAKYWHISDVWREETVMDKCTCIYA